MSTRRVAVMPPKMFASRPLQNNTAREAAASAFSASTSLDALMEARDGPETPIEAMANQYAPLAGAFTQQLLALAPQREVRKAEYCQLMQELRQDSLLRAIWLEVRAGNAPKKEYYLGYGFILNRYGLSACFGRERLSYLDVVNTPAEKFSPFHGGINEFSDRSEAATALAKRMQDISREIMMAYQCALPNNTQKPR